MDNVEIGPSSNEEWLLGDYAHARLMAPRIKALIDELNSHSPNGDDGGEEIISVPDRYNNNERGVTIQQVLDNLEYEMSSAYDSNLETDYGETNGFSVWPNSDVTIAQGSNMIVSNFQSGILLTDDIIDEYHMT